MQQKINEELTSSPALNGEEPHDEDLYSTLFPKAKKSCRHGLGMVVEGKGSEQLTTAMAALYESTKENKELRSMMNTLLSMNETMEEKLSQGMSRGAIMEEKFSQAMVRFEAFELAKPSQQEDMKMKQGDSTSDLEGSQAKVLVVITIPLLCMLIEVITM